MAAPGPWRLRALAFGVLAVMLAAGFAALGRWQLGRAQEKQTLLAHSAAVLQERAVRDYATLDPARSRGMDWTEVEGEFVDSPALLLDNQQREGRVGVRVYRLFRPLQGASLLVELGWLPLPPERELPRIERPTGARRIEGLLLPPPAPGLITAQEPQLVPEGLLLTRLDPTQLQAVLDVTGPLAARILRPDPDAPFGFQRDLDVLPNTLPPERHRGYAVQWFALAAAVVLTYLTLLWRAVRARKHS